VNADQVAVEGHSAGGAAASLFASDPRVDTWIGMARAPPVDAETVMAEGGFEDFDTAAYYDENDPPDKPSMLLAADDDVAIDLDEVESLYDWLPTPRRPRTCSNSSTT
jgi:pimeloyl-ACP methyl ester carboxylesterase